jgi:hypothetical protein
MNDIVDHLHGLGFRASREQRNPSSNGAWSDGPASGSAAGWDRQPKT